MATLDTDIRQRVLDHLARNGVSARRFGKEALADSGFVASLKRGRRLRLDTADKVLAFMGDEPIGPEFRCEVEAFLGVTRTKASVLGSEAVRNRSFVGRLRRQGKSQGFGRSMLHAAFLGIMAAANADWLSFRLRFQCRSSPRSNRHRTVGTVFPGALHYPEGSGRSALGFQIAHRPIPSYRERIPRSCPSRIWLSLLSWR